eukprot:6285445-Prorocentrum_lima.AAC.1
MTSSLVGSEMCIRDRLLNGSVRAVCVGGSVPGLRATEGRECDPPHLYCPVSYTHLTLPTICSV